MQTTFLPIAVYVLVLAATAACGAGEHSAEAPSGVAGCLSLDRIFGSKEFEVKRIGDLRWLANGSSFTTLEDSAADDSSPSSDESNERKSRDIVRHDCQTGEREVIVASTRLIPPGQSHPLKMDGYWWSTNEKKLLSDRAKIT